VENSHLGNVLLNPTDLVEWQPDEWVAGQQPDLLDLPA